MEEVESLDMVGRKWWWWLGREERGKKKKTKAASLVQRHDRVEVLFGPKAPPYCWNILFRIKEGARMIDLPPPASRDKQRAFFFGGWKKERTLENENASRLLGFGTRKAASDLDPFRAS